MKESSNLLILLFFASISFAQQKSVSISSPDGNLKVTVNLNDKIYYGVDFKGKPIITASPVSIQLADGKVIGAAPVLQTQKTVTVNTTIDNIINGRRKKIIDNYNEITITLKGNYAVVFRLYNEGFAYHFNTSIAGKIIVQNEEATFNFAGDYNMLYIPKVQYDNSGEGRYTHEKISQLPDSVYGLTPLIVEIPNGPKLAITESSLFDYAGLNIRKNQRSANSIIGSFAPDVESETGKGWVYTIHKRKNYIAETIGQRNFPWRVVVVAENDVQLADCDIVYKLAKPAANYTDLSWIKNGKAAWDWWADWSMAGVDFKGEPESLEYYKYMIDFAATNHLEFVEVSVGWMKDDDILDVSKKIRMPELMAYAKSKNIGVMLWVVAHTLERQFDSAFNLISNLGAAGVKVDFLDADHQGRINLYERIAKECMKRKLMVYYHGACKPFGLERTYPCIINYEGVQANEWNKWSKDETPKHTVEIAFIRNLAGPMDVNLGPMRNGQPNTFAISDALPMSMGTRCHQLAMYITYYAPFNMVADAPFEYINDKNCIQLISSIPSNWDNSKAIDGKISEYIIMARNKDANWYLSGLNNETARNGEVKLDFLGDGNYTATIFSDGVNANKIGTDYTIKKLTVNNKTILPYNMANGGGFAITIIPYKTK